jgi:hypothetical protein
VGVIKILYNEVVVGFVEHDDDGLDRRLALDEDA